MSDLSATRQQPAQTTPQTLGEVLYAKSTAAVPEQDWAKLVQSIAAGDQLALHALYERAHRPVFTLMMRLTANWETAEELTIDVFHDMRWRASRYDPDRNVLAHGNATTSPRARAHIQTQEKRTPLSGAVTLH